MPPEPTLIPLSDANDLDAVIHALGIEDSDTTPAEAVARRLVKLKENQRPEDALRCPHILDALIAFAEADTRAVHEAEQAHVPKYHKGDSP